MVSLADSFDRILEPLGPTMNRELAVHLAGLQVGPALQRRLDDLASRHTEQLLGQDELAEYEGHVAAVEVLAVLQVKARQALQQRVGDG
jgi:hypothetical protein